MILNISADGTARPLYTEYLDLTDLGPSETARASHVEMVRENYQRTGSIREAIQCRRRSPTVSV